MFNVLSENVIASLGCLIKAGRKTDLHQGQSDLGMEQHKLISVVHNVASYIIEITNNL